MYKIYELVYDYVTMLEMINKTFPDFTEWVHDNDQFRNPEFPPAIVENLEETRSVI